jgi:hypothetical protein
MLPLLLGIRRKVPQLSSPKAGPYTGSFTAGYGRNEEGLNMLV